MKEYYTNRGQGNNGCNTEANINAVLGRKPICHGKGQADIYHLNGHNTEVKTGSGEICTGSAFKPWKNSTFVIYVPVVNECEPIERQEGFIIRREAFVKILQDLNLCKYNKSRDKWNINTIWNRTKNAPHGTKIYRLLDRLYEECESTLEEFLEENM